MLHSSSISLRVKATVLVLGIVVTLRLITALVSVTQMDRHLESEQAHTASSIARSLAEASELALAVGDETELQRLARGFLWDDDTLFAAMYDANNRLVAYEAQDEEAWRAYIESGEARDRFFVASETVHIAGQQEMLFPGGDAPVETEEERLVGRIVIGLSTRPMLAAKRDATIWTIILTLGAVVTTGVVSYVLVGSWTRRLAALVRASERITGGDLSQEIRDPKNDEIGRLVHSYEEMRQALIEREAQQLHFHETLQFEVKERTRDLEKAKVAAEAAARAKTEFLANMSHEIRTPMTSILGYSELLSDPAISPTDLDSHVSVIRRNGEHLLAVVNDILDISKIEAGHMTTERIPCAPAQIVEDVTSIMQVRASERGLWFKTDGVPDPSEKILTDPTRLRQILMNLVANAIKFTESGGVDIRVSRRPGRGDEPDMMRFDIIDTGIGIPEEKLDLLFQPFSQADSSMARQYGGTGLGLTISRRLAHMLGGDITFETESGAGSTFSLTIAAPPAEAGAESNDDDSDAKSPTPATKLSGRILLAEDGPDNRRLVSFHLKRAGAEVEFVENGEDAMREALKADADGTSFDLILMDMQMPKMDGYTATRMLRREGYTGAIVALTAHAMEDDRTKCLRAGCDDYTHKPIDNQRLISICAAWMGRRSDRSVDDASRSAA